MMANKVFLKAFSDFEGINRGTNDLVRPKNQCKDNINFELDDDLSLVLRKGEKVISIPFQAGTSTQNTDLRGLLKHSYSDINTGLIKENILVLTRSTPYFMVLKTKTIRITYNASPLSYSMVAKDDQTGYNFILKNGNTTLLTFFCGIETHNNASYYTGKTLGDLATAINAISGLSCTLPMSGTTINSNQNSTQISLVSGHTFEIGDISIEASGAQAPIEYTTSTLISLQYTKNYPANTKLGLQNLLACTIPVANNKTNNSNYVDIDISFLQEIPSTCTVHPFINYNIATTAFTPINGVNIANSLFIGGKYISDYKGILKFDGNQIYRAGVYKSPDLVLSNSGTSGSLVTGATYKYGAILSTIDAQGYEIQGEMSSISQITTTGTAITVQYTGLEHNFEHFKFKANYFTGSYTINDIPVPITLTNTNNFRLGDHVWFRASTLTGNETEATKLAKVVAIQGNIVWFVVVPNRGYSSIIINSSQNNQCSTYKVSVYSSKPNNNSLFYNFSMPSLPFGFGPQSRINTTEGNGVQYIVPDEVDRPFPPPIMHAVEEHQGSLVGIGDFANPNTVYFSSQQSPEYMSPLNSFEASGGIQGKLTALKSDTESMLALFKEDAYYNIVGDLITGNFSFDIVTEGSIGCACQLSIQRVQDYLIFLSSVGFQKLRAGILDLQFHRNLSFDFKTTYLGLTDNKENFLLLNHAIGINDFLNQKYICSIPFSSIPQNTLQNTSWSIQNAKVYVYDYVKNAWYEKQYPFDSQGIFNLTTDSTGIFPCLGMQIRNKKVIFLTKGIDKFAGIVEQNSSNSIYDYSSNSLGLPATLKLQWEDLGEPSVEKELLQFKIYSFIVNNNLQPFKVRVYFERNFKEVILASDKLEILANFPVANNTIDPEFISKMNKKFRAIQPVFSNLDTTNLKNFINNPIRITGYEYAISDTYSKQDMRK